MEVKAAGYSRLVEMKAVFQQRQSAAREQRLLQETQNLDGLSRTMVQERRSAGSLSNGASLPGTITAGKVRQMFDERRRVATGIDKSFPLQPLKTKPAPPAKAEYAYKLPQKSTSSTRLRTQQQTTNPITSKTSTKVLRQAIATNGYADRRNGYNAKLNKSYDELANEIDYNQPNNIRPDFELSNLLNANHIEDSGTLDDIEFPDTSLEFEDMADYTTSTRRNSGSKLETKPVVLSHVKTSNSRLPPKFSSNGGGDVNRKTIPDRTRSITKPQIQNSVVKKTIPKSPAKENRTVKSPAQSPLKVPKSPCPKAATSTSSRPAPSEAVASALASGELVNCSICGRNFANDRIQKHREICQKTAQKKRKVYDALKHRVQGTDAEQFVRIRARKNPSGTSQIPKRPPLQTNWRKKHEDFINAIRAAKEVQQHLKSGGKLSDLPPPPPSENPDYVQCPHCGRRFNQAAAERHIPKCATMEHNKPKKNVPANSRGGAGAAAKGFRKN